MTDPTTRGDAWPERVQEALEGGPQASSRLLRALRPRLLAWARALTGDGDAAEDLCQDALVRITESLAHHGGGAFLTWAYRIVLNLHRDEARRRQRRATLVEGRTHDLPRPTPPGGADPSATVTAYVRELTPQQRAVFQLVDLEGWSAVEAAAALDLSPSTARVHLHRARRTVRSRILEDFR